MTDRPPCPDCGQPDPILLRKGKRGGRTYRTWECRGCDCVWSVREDPPEGDGPFPGDRAVPRRDVRRRVLRRLAGLLAPDEVAEVLSGEVTAHTVKVIVGDLATRELAEPEELADFDGPPDLPPTPAGPTGPGTA